MSNWFERLLDTVADHGRDLLGLLSDEQQHTDERLCQELIKGQGEATNIALARELLQRWSSKDETQKLVFLQMLSSTFDPDPEAVMQAAQAYSADDYESLQKLIEVAEPPRQELLRRLNMAPGGTAVLVDMRSFLLTHVRQHLSLKKLDADFQHLLASWFNYGFLQLARIDWNTSATILEKLIQFEAVHPMKGWEDLRRRLAEDRRCFAFFHPALPQQPLIFVEVALTREISDSIATLIDPDAPVENPAEANSAIFYSINNALTGLRGVSFGNFLIKQVANELHKEFPQLKNFVTLSPIPGLRGYLESRSEEDLQILLGEQAGALKSMANTDKISSALDELISRESGDQSHDLLQGCLQRLALCYLAGVKRQRHAYDPVAHFHLSNGARLERINTFANMSAYGLHQSYGCMVNYRYDNASIVANHEAYVNQAAISLSKELEKQLKSADLAETIA